ncbi:MAG: acyltransferase [Vulcanimicrobiaceae bacterium]
MTRTSSVESAHDSRLTLRDMILGTMRLMRFVQKRWFGFREFGARSIIKPLPSRISGAKYISVGRDCFFGEGLILVASDEHRGRKHSPNCVIGDRCAFGAQLMISCTNSIRIGNDVLASARVFIGDSYHGYEDVTMPISDQPMSGEAPVVIGDGCFLGIGCAILPGVTLGKGCCVGANAVVTRSFGDHTVVVGSPARAVRTYDPTTGWQRPRRIEP